MGIGSWGQGVGGPTSKTPSSSTKDQGPTRARARHWAALFCGGGGGMAVGVRKEGRGGGTRSKGVSPLAVLTLAVDVCDSVGGQEEAKGRHDTGRGDKAMGGMTM